MKQAPVVILLLLLCSSLSAQQPRVDAGVAAGYQSYEAPDLGSQLVISPELLVSRGRLSAYYALDRADLSSEDIRRGTLFASHLGVAYGWPIGRNVAVRAGAGPSYVSVTYLGGKPTWHAQLELSLRRSRLEWFAKVRHYDYSLEKLHAADASSDGPVLLAGLRYALLD